MTSRGRILAALAHRPAGRRLAPMRSIQANVPPENIARPFAIALERSLP